ncbi:MAG: hypothetical protein FIB08_04600 [Candidatus Methanoperedens sp.]|nr:hypothetical protein [Candidatus Methanoperedens sp.]
MQSSRICIHRKYIIETPYFSASTCLNFFKGLGHKIGKVSLLDLENYLQERYLFFFASHKIKDRMQKCISGQVLHERQDRLWQENAVFLELKRPQQHHYWKSRDGLEADFVIRGGDQRNNPGRI